MKDMWNQRFSAPGFAYGSEPNDWLKAVAPGLEKGRALCLGDGEGRNGVYLAQQGFEVTSVDLSEVGLNKAQELARSRGVKLTTQVADLEQFPIEAGQWELIVSIWCHLPSALRRKVFAASVNGLVSGGAFVLEHYTPKQLEFGTGGPKSADLLSTLSDLKVELTGLEFAKGQELVREIHEGALHEGQSAVVQVLALKP
jgi:SAM-dependent methyltransferase